LWKSETFILKKISAGLFRLPALYIKQYASRMETVRKPESNSPGQRPGVDVSHPTPQFIGRCVL
jgi:hypothetical protein